jgi:hypothetical protein
VKENIRQFVIDIANEEIALLNNQVQHLEEQEEAQNVPRENWPLPLDDLDIFDELNNNYLEEVQYRDNKNNSDLVDVALIAIAVDAELTLYEHEPSRRLKNDDSTFTCPLTWWKFNERNYKLLSKLAASC